MTIVPNTLDVDLTETWLGGSGDWSSAANWTVTVGSPVTPVTGDILNIVSCSAVMHGAEAPGYGPFDGFTIELGAAESSTPGVLQLATTSTGRNTEINVLGDGSIEALGQSSIGGFSLTIMGPSRLAPPPPAGSLAR
jgi:hypothetical protein